MTERRRICFSDKRTGIIPMTMMMLCLNFLFQMVAWIYFIVGITYTDCKEYCHNDEFTAECNQQGQVILVTSALYGRMHLGACVKTDFGFVGCYVDVIAHAHERCSGRKSCVMRVPDATLDKTKPCNEDLKSYLEATYSCVSVAIPRESSSCNIDLSSDPEQTSGYISSLEVIAGDGPKRCGSTGSPWIIKVPTGQRINVTLLDFSSMDGGGQAVNGTIMLTTAVSCDQYATFEEEGTKKSQSLCGNGNVESAHAYATSGQNLKVTISYRKEEYSRFLLKYDAVGCPDLPATPPNVWLQRQSNRMLAGCRTSDVKWQLDCVGTRWEGISANCSTVGSDARIEDGLASLSVGFSILIILGVSLAIGIVVLLLGLYYIKRRREGGNPVVGRGLQLRDMKPLGGSNTAYEAASVYACNTAFEPVRVNTNQRCPATAGGKSTMADGNEYEYVWDMPSNMIPTVRTSSGDMDCSEEASCMARPDLVKTEPKRTAVDRDRDTSGPMGAKSRVQCSCLSRTPLVKHRGGGPHCDERMTGPPPASSSSSGRFASLESRSNARQRDMAKLGDDSCGGGTVSRKTMDFPKSSGGWESSTGGDTLKLCRHCGHAVPETSMSRGGGGGGAGARFTNPSSATVSRRHFPDSTAGAAAVTMRRPKDTTSGKINVTMSTTLPRPINKR